MHMWLNYRSHKDTLISLCSWGECIVTYNAIQNSFASVARDIEFYVVCEQTHVLPISFFQSSWQWMDIVFSVNGTCTLVDVVIVDPTYVNLILWVDSSWGAITMIITQTKIVSYHNRHLKDDFIPLVVEIFGCLHQ